MLWLYHSVKDDNSNNRKSDDDCSPCHKNERRTSFSERGSMSSEPFEPSYSNTASVSDSPVMSSKSSLSSESELSKRDLIDLNATQAWHPRIQKILDGAPENNIRITDGKEPFFLRRGFSLYPNPNEDPFYFVNRISSEKANDLAQREFFSLMSDIGNIQVHNEVKFSPSRREAYINVLKVHPREDVTIPNAEDIFTKRKPVSSSPSSSKFHEEICLPFEMEDDSMPSLFSQKVEIERNDGNMKAEGFDNLFERFALMHPKDPAFLEIKEYLFSE